MSKTYSKTKFEVCIMAYSEDDAGVYAEAYTRAYTKYKSKIYARTHAKAYIDAIIEAKAKAYAAAYKSALSKAFDKAYVIPYAEAYAKAYFVAYAKAYPKAKTKAKVKIQAKAKAEAEAEIEAEAEAGAKAEAEVEAETVANAEAEPVARAEAEPVARAEAELVAKAEVEPAAKTEAEAKAEAEARVGTLNSLYDLSTDCLRLSTYFFHPIQKCAQQVYHTAVPLSPTSTQLYESYSHSVIDNQLSHVTAFSGAPNTWGSLLRAIDIRPRQLTCITTSAQRVIAACEDIVNIYSAVTFAFQQSLCTPETVIKIQGSSDGSILFFAHSFSVTVWDVQTGGLIHTFTVSSKINDMIASVTHVACGSSDSSVTLWDIHTKEEIKCFGDGQPIINIFWLPHPKLAAVTQRSICIHNFTLGTLGSFPIPHQVWGAVYLVDRSVFMVGISSPSKRDNQEQSYFVMIKYMSGCLHGLELGFSMLPVQLACPVLVGEAIACITPPTGVQLFDTESRSWTNNPPLLNAATSLAVSMDRNLVVQTKDSIQFFPIDILTGGGDKAHRDAQLSHIYPLGKNHIICILQPTRNLTLLELETLQELHNSLVGSLLADQLTSAHGLVAEFGISAVVGAWQSSSPLPKRRETAEDAPLYGWSPECT